MLKCGADKNQRAISRRRGGTTSVYPIFDQPHFRWMAGKAPAILGFFFYLLYFPFFFLEVSSKTAIQAREEIMSVA